jgi:hypothetical protein
VKDVDVSRLSLLLSLTALICACGAKPPPAPEPPRVASAELDAGSEDAATDGEPDPSQRDASEPLPPATTSEEVAARWLEALRRADPVLLGDWSRYPFLLHDTGDEGTCGQGAAADAGQLSRLLGCILHNEPLLAELRAEAEPALRAIKTKELPSWARRWRNELAPEAILVLALIPGHGNSTQFVLVVLEGGVQAAWKLTSFETAQTDVH